MTLPHTHTHTHVVQFLRREHAWSCVLGSTHACFHWTISMSSKTLSSFTLSTFLPYPVVVHSDRELSARNDILCYSLRRQSRYVARTLFKSKYMSWSSTLIIIVSCEVKLHIDL